MNRKTIIAIATLAIASLTSCSAQQRQMFNNAREDDKPPTSVVDQGLTVVAVPSQGSVATVTVPASAQIPCGNTGGGDCQQPATPPTTVYAGPPLMQCENGSFAEQGECPPPATQP